jgi:hypothetical protein
MYKAILNSTGVLRQGDNAIIPEDAGNADWQTYQAWVADGNTPDAADPEVPEQHNAPILSEIAVLEAKQARALRELALGIDAETAQSKLEEYDTQITALRAGLEEAS